MTVQVEQYEIGECAFANDAAILPIEHFAGRDVILRTASGSVSQCFSRT